MVDFEPIAISGAGLYRSAAPESVFAIVQRRIGHCSHRPISTDVFPVTSVPSSPTSRLVIGSVIAKPKVDEYGMKLGLAGVKRMA